MRKGYDKPVKTDSYMRPSPPASMQKNPKQSSPGRTTSDPFGDNYDSAGSQGIKGNLGLPGKGTGDGAHRGGSPRDRKGKYSFG
jgi:hypothetical protein